ncbi:hypothetical protein H5P28_12520 [Ruficoccus amylovorans]|uniref:Uncharacterized protein n=1 Tax=Ruficoccus amylovorans TaxID=1804625 RepID=A0A842HEY5_9BACT|nr:hypothetical protein [Ruficoccus amylovorans]MBC2595083.1 hypothetical protein [Ruficoccus amylovorans]
MKNKNPLLLLGLLGILLLVAFSTPDITQASSPATAANRGTIVGHPDRPSEFIKHDPDGNVILHGYYERNAQGLATRYTVYDGSGELLYTMLPYPGLDNRYLRCDQFSPSGQLEKVFVGIGDKIVVLGPDGNVLETMPGNTDFAPETFFEVTAQ